MDRLSLIRYSSTTHSTNTDQRLIELQIVSQKNGRVRAIMPLNGAIAPPGNYMLFALSEGIPSVAKTINLQANNEYEEPEIEKDLKSGTLAVTSPSILRALLVGLVILVMYF